MPAIFRKPAVLLALLVFAAPYRASAQDPPVSARSADANAIDILEPAVWRTVEPGTATVKSRASLRIVGRAHHPSGIHEVLVNGDRAAVQALGDGRIQFVGYVHADRALREVEIAALTTDGQTYRRVYPITVEPATRVYASPESAWASAGAAAARPGFRGKRWAVVIGISEYEDSRIEPLEFADRDATAFREFLLSERSGLGGFDKENVITLLNREATYTNIRTALFSFLKASTEDDQVIIYFAGHGVPDPGRPREMYLLPYNARVDNLSGTAFPMQDIMAATRNILARDILVIADACHSAAVGGQVARQRDITVNDINRIFLQDLNASTGGLTVFTASEASQLSYEGKQWGGGHGIFTWHLLEALRGAADEDQDRIVTLNEMLEYTREKVRRETANRQIPTIGQTTFDRSLPMAIVLDPSVYAEKSAQPLGPLPSIFAAPEPPSAVRGRYSTGGALARGLTLPGMGMFYVDKPIRGMAYAFGSAYMLAWGILQEDIPPIDRACTDDWYVGCDELVDKRRTQRVRIGLGIWALGAVDAAFTARRHNARAERLRRSRVSAEAAPMTSPDAAVGSRSRFDPARAIQPAILAAPDGIGLQVVRIAF